MKTLRMVGIALMFIFCLSLLFESHAVVNAQETAAQQNANVQFQWAFGALKKANGSKFEAVMKDTDLKTGDQIKFFLKVNKNCFVYLIYRSSQGELSVLFPQRFKLKRRTLLLAGYR